MSTQRQMSRWLQDHVQVHQNFGQATSSLTQFFKVGACCRVLDNGHGYDIKSGSSLLLQCIIECARPGAVPTRSFPFPWAGQGGLQRRQGRCIGRRRQRRSARRSLCVPSHRGQHRVGRSRRGPGQGRRRSFARKPHGVGSRCHGCQWAWCPDCVHAWRRAQGGSSSSCRRVRGWYRRSSDRGSRQPRGGPLPGP